MCKWLLFSNLQWKICRSFQFVAKFLVLNKLAYFECNIPIVYFIKHGLLTSCLYRSQNLFYCVDASVCVLMIEVIFLVIHFCYKCCCFLVLTDLLYYTSNLLNKSQLISFLVYKFEYSLMIASVAQVY